MKGHIRRRGKASWEIKYDAGRDPVTGKRLTRYVSVKGKRADAERKLREVLGRIDKGINIEPTKITVGEYLDEWLDKSAPRTVAPVSLQRYHSLSRNQIKPHLGTIPLQRLRPADIDGWLQNLIEAGNISTRTIQLTPEQRNNAYDSVLKWMKQCMRKPKNGPTLYQLLKKLLR